MSRADLDPEQASESRPSPAPDGGADNTEMLDDVNINSDGNCSDDVSVSRSETPARSEPPVPESPVPEPQATESPAPMQPANEKSLSSLVFIEGAMKAIKKSKDAKRIPVLDQSVTKVLKQLEENPDSVPNASTILEPLRIVCAQGSSTELRAEALDCIGKLFTFSVLQESVDPNAAPTVPILERAVDIVCDTFDGESTDSRIELQIVKALTAAAVNEDSVIHGPTLLKAIRQVYNIFVVSRSQPNQYTAQVSLTQMVQAVFERLKAMVSADGGDATNAPSMESVANTSTNLTLERLQGAGVVEEEPAGVVDADFVTQDAFLVFRTLCKLSEKTDVDLNELKGHGMRSKLLSLHLLHITLKEQISVFASQSLLVKFRSRNIRFTDAIKDYLCSTLSHNAASISPAVFEISAEIFSLVLSNLRSEFKHEIEVFFREIYFTIMEMRTATLHQKMYFLGLVSRICSDPRSLVELYLNYDCDPSAINIFEKLVEMVGRIAVMPVHISQTQLVAYFQDRNHSIAVYNLNLPPSLSIDHIVATHGKLESSAYPLEFAMKVTALEALVSVLRSFMLWSQREFGEESLQSRNSSTSSVSGAKSENGRRDSDSVSGTLPSVRSSNGHSRQVSGDDPTQFQTLKTNKKALDRAMADFNYKPSRGIDSLIAAGIISAKEPEQVARVLLENEGFDKHVIGEYMGKDDEFNKAVMHHFLKQMNFKGLSFIDALRAFLQKFRLPGEGQVVDRYMLEFSTKYVDDNPTVFSDADVPYTLAYSVMMLNTELHSAQAARASGHRMSVQEFITNNRGINGGLDLPDDFLTNIYNEIRDNEIKLLSEHHQAAIRGVVDVRDSREAYLMASEFITTKTSKLFKSMNTRDRKSVTMYYNASHAEHIHPMFEVSWMSILAGLSASFQEDKADMVKVSLEGMYLALRIACHYEIGLARTSFINSLTQFSGLNRGDISSLHAKNISAIQTLLQVALTEGNMLHESWKDVLVMISQFERLQLIVLGGLSAESIPDVGSLRRESSDRFSRAIMDMSSEVAESLRSRDLAVKVDKIFTQSSNLSAEAITEFVKALAEVALDEIESSKDAAEPRLFSLQKIVDVCYYNMARIRREWSQIWAQMGLHFNNVTCHSNEKVVYFALDSLRQLSTRFLDLEELPHFKFQKDFLSPFVYTMEHSHSEEAKGLVIECLSQMVMAKPKQLVSGWAAIFAALTAAASQEYSVVKQASKMLTMIGDDHMAAVIAQDALTPYFEALAALGKQRDAKIAINAVDRLRATDKLLVMSQDESSWTILSQVLDALHNVVMQGVDLEVRGRALNHLFDLLMEHGSSFSKEEWDLVGSEQIFPLFSILETPKSRQDEDTTLWLSTTLVQALRQIVNLFGRYFDMLEHSLDSFFLSLLKTCICQENDTVSRIGASCLVALVENNAERFTDKHWQQVVDKIEYLFRKTTASALMDASLIEGPPTDYKIKVFNRAIMLSVQQILIINSAGEILEKPVVAEKIPAPDSLRIAHRLKESYEFARVFNLNHEARITLYHQGYMKQMPNLLMQESVAAQNYICVGTALFRDKAKLEDDTDGRNELRTELLHVCRQILADYNNLLGTDYRHVKIMTPIVICVLKEVCLFDDGDFRDNVHKFYNNVIDLLNKDMSRELREAVQAILRRVAEVHFANESTV